ncbi:MAG TPA: pirin family protein [Pirellulales bacterium]
MSQVVHGAKRPAKIVRQVPAHWVGDGFPVRSLFSYREGALFDPFLLLDYAGPHKFAPAEAPGGVGEHPHRGFETVTIVYQGEVAHRDSSGGGGLIGPGDVQWMTAASGLVHEEFHGEKFAREGGLLEMVQLWVNLPSKDKSAKPRYQSLLAKDIHTAKLPNADVRVIAGELAGVRGPAQTFTPIHVWDVNVTQSGEVRLPVAEGYTTLAVVQTGEATFEGNEVVKDGELVLFHREGNEATFSASAGSRVLVLAGEPIGEPVVGYGPFVMNTAEEIQQAVEDYHAGRMGRLDGANA